MRAGVVVRVLAAVALAVAAVWCAQRGVVVRPSTGGLLIAPVNTVRIVGAWIALAVVAGTAALLVALAAARTLILALRAGREPVGITGTTSSG